MWTEEKLNSLLTEPSDRLARVMREIKGGVTVLGASGKMGPSLCILANNALKKSGSGSKEKKITAVARFTDKESEKLLKENGIETISCDLLNAGEVAELPPCENVIYMAGRKFGTSGAEYQTWAVNSVVPAYVIDKYKKANYVVFSSGNVYPFVKPLTGGCREEIKPSPIGEYAMSCLARERAFEYAAGVYGANVFIYRLNYAVDLRYGALYDIAANIMNGVPVSLTVPSFNCVWQGYANEAAISGLLHAANPVKTVNVTGPETVSVRKAAGILGGYLGKSPVFSGEEGEYALLSDSSLCCELFGYPDVPLGKLLKWQAEWIADGGRGLGKPTHFEENGGNF